MDTVANSGAEVARFVLSRRPGEGLFAGQDWRISTKPFEISRAELKQIESLGRVLLQFYRATNLLYRKSLEGKLPAWPSNWLDQGKPEWLLELQRHPTFKSDVPRVIRPDILLTGDGLKITELDSVPGGIGATAWLNESYSQACAEVVGGERGMIDGFASIFGDSPRTHIVISRESETYKPEMDWLVEKLGERFQVVASDYNQFSEGDSVYRFFELFDVPNVAAAEMIFKLGSDKKLQVTPPPKPIFEEKLLLALLWNRNLREFWRQELGESFLKRLQENVPYSWVMDPTPLPPQGAIPELNLTDWSQLKALSQKERELIIKISGFSEKAWGSRGVYLGSDLSQADWAEAVDTAINSFGKTPYVLQRYYKPKVVEAEWFDFESGSARKMEGRVRLCPYYFVSGNGDAARANLGGILATICPADKKIIHGMTDAILAPVRAI